MIRRNGVIGRWTRRQVLAGGTAAVAAGLAGARRYARAADEGTKLPTSVRYVDGLSLVPSDSSVAAGSGLDACIVDASAGEMIDFGPDGDQIFVRTFNACEKRLSEIHALAGSELPNVYVATHGSEVGQRSGLGLFLQCQSCEPIEDRLERIEYFHTRGLRVLQITHNHDNQFGGAAMEPIHSGLTPLGIDGLAEMNRLGIVVDVAHASELTALDVARYCKAPFVISHGACRAIVDSPRCASDEMIKAVADSGGMMGIFMISFWLTKEALPVTQHYIAQLRHVIRVGGIDAAGIANDYPMLGLGEARKNGNEAAAANVHSWWLSMHRRGVAGFADLPRHAVIPELNGIDRMRRIHQALEREGFRSSEIEKIMGGNWVRVLTEVLG